MLAMKLPFLSLSLIDARVAIIFNIDFQNIQ